MGWDPAVVPDPQDPATFARSKLDWDEVDEGAHARLLALYTALLQLRRERPELTDPRFGHTTVELDEHARWIVLHRGSLSVLVNLGDKSTSLTIESEQPSVLLSTSVDVHVDAGTRNGAAVRLPGCAAVIVER